MRFGRMTGSTSIGAQSGTTLDRVVILLARLAASPAARVSR